MALVSERESQERELLTYERKGLPPFIVQLGASSHASTAMLANMSLTQHAPRVWLVASSSRYQSLDLGMLVEEEICRIHYLPTPTWP